MLPRLDYLAFATRWFGGVAYDLAASNPKVMPAVELGDVAVDDRGSRAEFRTALARPYSVPEAEVLPVLGASGGPFAAFAHGVVVSPGEFFGDPSSFRLSWAVRAETVAIGLELVGQVLDP